jgi:hypothetical protein
VPAGASLLRWSQRHSDAARSARTAARSNGFAGQPPLDVLPGPAAEPVADSLARWSRRHGGRAEDAAESIAGTGEPNAAAPNAAASNAAASNAAGPTPTATTPDPPAPARSAAVGVHPEPVPAPSPRGDGRRRALVRLAGFAAVLGWLVALLMVVHAAFVVLRANPANPWTMTVGSWAPALDLGLGDLATSAGPTVALLVGHGAAAVAWVAIGTATGWLIRRLGAR